MAEPQKSSLADVFTCVNSVYDQCRNLIRDAVRLLRDNEGVFLNQIKNWDYAWKPFDHFLEQEFSCVRRCWLAYTIGGGEPQQGAFFCLEFFHPHRPMAPSLMFGTAHAGATEFDEMDKWALFYTLTEAERGDEKYTISHDGPLAVVETSEPKRCSHAALVQVPLECIVSQSELERLVVKPMAAILRGDRAVAKALVEQVPVIPWPARGADVSEQEEDKDAAENP